MNLAEFLPQTSGEHLFILLLKELFGDESLPSLQSLPILSIGGRTEFFSEVFLGMAALNVLARLIKKAERTRSIENPNLHHAVLVDYIQTSMEVSRRADSDFIDRLARLALIAAADSKKKIKDAVKNAVCGGRRELSCYICGCTVLRKSSEEENQIEFEHLWPASFGGNSVEENILPSCPACNRAKGSMLLWQTGHISSFVLKPQPSTDELTMIGRREKIAKHTKKIFDRACHERVSLKSAALAVGPVSMSSIYPDDTEDSVDFFNFSFQ